MQNRDAFYSTCLNVCCVFLAVNALVKFSIDLNEQFRWIPCGNFVDFVLEQ